MSTSGRSLSGFGPLTMLRPGLVCGGPRSLSDYLLNWSPSRRFDGTGTRAGGTSLDHDQYRRQIGEIIEEMERTGEYDRAKLATIIGPRIWLFEDIRRRRGHQEAVDFLKPVEKIYVFRGADGLPRMKFESELTDEDREILARKEKDAQSGADQGDERRSGQEP